MTEEPRHRPIRSYVLRAGRMTEGQRRAFDANWSRWGLSRESGPLDPARAFGREAPLVLEIGFGMGDSLAQMAADSADINYLGIEVHKPGVGKLLHRMVEQDIENIRVYCDDAVAVMQECLAEASLDGIQIFFPDPWHKKRHHKRRLIQPDFLHLLCSRLRPGGFLHLATDWENYAEQMLEVLGASQELRNLAGQGNYSPRPEHRPLTKFERRGQGLGHGVWDLIFERLPGV
jgi:tRNA (guanine-N7-)-methyltransferase